MSEKTNAKRGLSHAQDFASIIWEQKKSSITPPLPPAGGNKFAKYRKKEGKSPISHSKLQKKFFFINVVRFPHSFYYRRG